MEIIETCARCGHTAPTCERCGRTDPFLGAAIGTTPYCHTFSSGPRTCYSETLFERAFRLAGED